MSEPFAAVVVFGYLAVALALGLIAGRKGAGGVTDFVAGDRAFGPVLMYFVMGATIFSAYALLGTPQRVVAKGSDMFYIFAFGSVGFVPLFFMGAKIRRIGARFGYVTQAEFVGARFESRWITGLMGIASVASFVPYLVIQMKGAGIVLEAVTGWSRLAGAACVYAVVVSYVVLGGVRGVGWTNVLQGIVMLVVVWTVGLAVPAAYFGGVEGLFDEIVARHPAHLTLPGPQAQTSDFRYTSEVLLSVLGFSMWPHVFMKCFTARSARLVQLSVAMYPTFLLFLLPLVFLGYTAVALGGPSDDSVLLWIARLPEHHPDPGSFVQWLGEHGILMAGIAFAILAASMSTGDALLHGAASIFVRDVWVQAAGRSMGERAQTTAIRVFVLLFALLGWQLFALAGSLPVVELLLLSYAIPVQFLPLVLFGLYWRGATRRGGELGLASGLLSALGLFALQHADPAFYALVNPGGFEIGFLSVAVNAVVLVCVSLWTTRNSPDHLAKFELGAG